MSDEVEPGAEFKFSYQTLRQRGPRVHIKIKWLPEHIEWFNREKTWLVYRFGLLPFLSRPSK